MIRILRCRECQEPIELDFGMESMVLHWERMHARQLQVLRAAIADQTKAKFPGDVDGEIETKAAGKTRPE